MDTGYQSALLPDDAERARLIVCERTGRWAVALRRELLPRDVRVWETRGLDECWEMLRVAPASFVLVEVSAAGAGDTLRRIGRLSREFPLARVAGVADRSLADLQWPVREAGAVHFVCSARLLGPLARLAWRHLDRAPEPSKSAVERIWASLPWSE